MNNKLERLLNTIKNKEDRLYEERKIYRNLDNYSEIRGRSLVKSRIRGLEIKLNEYEIYKNDSKTAEIYWRACAGWNITKKDLFFILNNEETWPKAQLNGHVLYPSILMENFEKRGLVLWDHQKKKYFLKEQKKESEEEKEEKEEIIQKELSEKYLYFIDSRTVYEMWCDSVYTQKVKKIEKNHLKIINNLFKKHNCNKYQFGIIKIKFKQEYWIVGIETEDYTSEHDVRRFLKKTGV